MCSVKVTILRWVEISSDVMTLAKMVPLDFSYFCTWKKLELQVMCIYRKFAILLYAAELDETKNT